MKLTKSEKLFTARVLDEVLQMWERNNVPENQAYYDIVDIIIKLGGIDEKSNQCKNR